MKVSSLPAGGIYDVRFGYNAKQEGYMTLMSDIPELSVMPDLVLFVPRHPWLGRRKLTGFIQDNIIYVGQQS